MRLATCGEYISFMEDRGYARPELWLSEGWKTVQAHHWIAPLYWEKIDGQWHQFTCSGMKKSTTPSGLHISYYEADAFARWAGARLPPNLNGKSQRPSSRSRAICWRTDGFIPNLPHRQKQQPRQPKKTALCKSSATSGSGPPALSFLIRDTSPQPERWANITQVHEQPDGPARRLLRNTALTYSRQLSQFLSSGNALAVLRHKAR